MWYGVSLLFKSCHQQPQGEEPLWEEIIIIVEAPSRDEAEALARRNALTREVGYEVAGNDFVTWVFDSVFDVCEVESEPLSSGTEVFSRFMRESEVRSLQSKFE